VPDELNGLDLTNVDMHVFANSSSGLPTVQMYNETNSQFMLSTALTVDANEADSSTATTPAVIDAAQDHLTARDVIRFDVTVEGTGTKGCQISIGVG